jgi:RNA polymerase sigma-70 factor (ECF subfamily)
MVRPGGPSMCSPTRRRGIPFAENGRQEIARPSLYPKGSGGRGVGVEKEPRVTMTDDALLARGAAGDDRSLRILVERWEGPVYSFLLRMLGSREDAQDLTQETFLRMIEAAPRYHADGRFRSWLFRIAGNQARSRLRRRRVIRWLSLDLSPGDPPSGAPHALDRLQADERRAGVRRHLAALPERQRQALLLKYDHDLSYREIADAMQTTVASVQMLLHRATAAMRGRLEREEDLS